MATKAVKAKAKKMSQANEPLAFVCAYARNAALRRSFDYSPRLPRRFRSGAACVAIVDAACALYRCERGDIVCDDFGDQIDVRLRGRIIATYMLE